MRLAVNDTPLARAALRDGRLDVDAVETSGPKVNGFRAAFPATPALLHVPVWDWSLAHPHAPAQRNAAARIDAALDATGAPWLSLHVGFAAATVAFDDGMKPTSPVLSRDATLAAMTATVRQVAARVGVPVLLENLDLQPGGAYEHVCDPGFLRELLQATDTLLLLDLAHAQVSASRMGLPIGSYLDALPLERVRQVHLSGPRERGGVLWDAHETLRDVDLRLLQEVLARTEPWAVTLEYGRDAGALEAQLALLRQRVTTG